ncbi:MAG: hypothetical protein KC457_02920 [Myxococcales bacterium]|nr:hypothetical protein [Myxococcales bacterium]
MTDLLRTPLAPVIAGLVAASLLVTLPVLPRPAMAAPSDEAPAEAKPEAPETAEQPAAEVTDAATIEAVEAALAEGELGRASELAVALREAQPTLEHHRLEAWVWEALGDYQQAKAAIDRALESLEEDDPSRPELEAEWTRLDDASRGTVADEPASTHRQRLDDERAARLAALAPKPTPPPPVIDVAPKREPIVKKWYFWVTLGALVASAAAIVGIAVAANVEDRKNVGAARLPKSGPAVGAGPGGLVFRF